MPQTFTAWEVAKTFYWLMWIVAICMHDPVGWLLYLLFFAFVCGWVWQGIQYLRGQPNLFQEEDGNAN